MTDGWEDRDTPATKGVNDAGGDVTKRLHAIGGIALTLTLLLAGVPAAGATGPGHGAANHAPRGMAGPPERPTPLEDVVRSVVGRDGHDPHARSRALRTFLEQHWDVPDAMDGHEEAHEQYALPAPAGDVSGDGLADVFVSAWTAPDGAHVVQALRGVDGEELWRAESSWDDGLAWPADADLTGDGVNDLLVWGWTFEDADAGSDCLPVYPLTECTEYEEVAYTAVVGVRSGTDGSLAWSTRHDGVERWELHHSGTPLDHHDRERITVTNALTLPYLSGDHDDDGGRDLLLNAVDLEWEIEWSSTDLVVAGREEGTDRTRFTTRAMLVSGATGQTQVLRAVDDTPMIGTLKAADDEGAALFWTAWTWPDWEWSCEHTLGDGQCTGSQEEVTGRLEMLDGRTLGLRWQRPLDKDDTPLAMAADLTGDGQAELFVDHWSFDYEGNLTAHGRVLDGADGTMLWAREGGWHPLVVPPLDGTGADDVLRVSQHRDGDAVVGSMERIHGATGESLSTTYETQELDGAADAMVWAAPVGDVTGDGVPDMGWQTVRVWMDEPCGPHGGASACWFYTVRAETGLRVEDARTGATLHAARFDGYGTLATAGDLDGDGAGDVLQAQAGQGPLRWSAVDISEGRELWHADFADVTSLTPAGDLLGTGTSQLLRHSTPVEGNGYAVVGSVEGTSGAQPWSRRYE